jgi:TPR repeat protein
VHTFRLIASRVAAAGAGLFLPVVTLAAPLPDAAAQQPFKVPAKATPAEKFALAQKASNDPAAQCLVGECYRNGWGCEPNGRTALEWFVRSATNGYHRGQAMAAVMALELRNFPVAQKWYGVCAKRGDVEAQFRYGNLYDANYKVPGRFPLFKVHMVPNYRSADWYIENGGTRRVRVYPVPVDYSEACKWYQKAAAQGHVSAQNNLGVMYAHGLGVRADLLEAYKWLHLASRNAKGEGYPMKHNFDALIEHMTPKQVEEAKARVASKQSKQS